MKTRRQPTEAQRAAAAERRERFKAIAACVAAMNEDEHTAMVMRLGAIVTCKGHALSAFNSCLVLTQLPTASMVGGFHQWRTKRRKVKKGEHGLMIWIPTGPNDKGEDAAPVPAPEAGAEKHRRAGFVMGYVFDVTQTEPALDGPELYRRAADACAASDLGAQLVTPCAVTGPPGRAGRVAWTGGISAGEVRGPGAVV